MNTATKSSSELNFRTILIGITLSIVMGAANVYLGLKAGMTVSASIPAAVVGMLILRLISKKASILEANQIQTAASAGESLAAGIIFTMPALIIIGVWNEFDMLLTTVIAFTGGLLGILFMIPMRKVFIVSNVENLKYPEGVACASVLEAGQEQSDSGDAISIIQGSLIGGLFKVFISFFGLFKGTLEGAVLAGNRIFFFGGDISPALLAVGYIVRLNVAILIFLGGFLGWLIGIPILGNGLDYSGNLVEGAYSLWSSYIRYVGVGAMVVGGIASIIKVRHGLIEAIRVLRKKSNSNNINEPDSEKDIPSYLINGLSILAIFLVGVVYYHLTGALLISLLTTFIMVIMAFFFTAVASYIVGLVGNSNSPVSGMTITAVLFTGGLLYILGFEGVNGMIATLGVAAIVCCAACTAGDVCNDLKTGHMVGSSPYRQQIMQIAGVAVASLIMAPILQLLHENTPGGIGGRELPAPQAGLFAELAKGFFGSGELPWNMVLVGSLIGVIILFFDNLLEKNNITFRLHLMPIAVGMYLPFGLSTPILIGGIISHFILKKNEGKDPDSVLQKGLLFSSGLIAGESLMGVGLALLSSIGIARMIININSSLSFIITSLAAIITILVLYRKASVSDDVPDTQETEQINTQESKQ